MKRIKVSDNFFLDEFVPKSAITQLGDRARFLVCPEIFEAAQFIRDHINRPMVINDWATGGPYQNRGWRSLYSRVGSKASWHKLGRAFDFDIPGMSIDQTFNEVIHISEELYNIGLRRIESKAFTPSWIHLDMAGNERQGKRLRVFQP